ncbi:ABC transporter ATP-binding protein [Parablautia intestinalis]|jgi:ATP-binding cassette subfamily B multidrug efflux pump|uniref:ABC transporter ATP-binding protein n=1 Tax=Parablautia intestinalis TaxID=2320100 RepID=A0A3A9AH08_9FIRM|nr:ABC transporter ATP-binding protein [Parablautia intestinalis]MCI8615723.1 ABC transporter ATP-binding protein [Lachnospiraceae bacterium]RKI90920.1 ABC transporter ATP-binding protein [Parablautia intestinalis]
MGKLLVYLKDYKKESVLGPLFKLLEASFELVVPLLVASMIDVGIANGDKSYIIKMCVVMTAFGLIGLICSVTAQYFAARAAVGFATRLRHELFAHIQRLSFSQMDREGTSTLITRMTSDINQVQSGVNLVLRLFLRSPFIVFGAMIMAFTVDVKAALIFVVVIPVLSIIVFGIMLVSIPLFKKVQSGLDGVLGITRENLTGVRVIRAFGEEEEEIQKFDKETDALKRMQMLAGRISALMNPLTYVVINGGLIALIYVGALRVEAGILSQGQVVALVNYMSQILVELIKLANLIITVTKAVACGNRIESIFEIPAGLEEVGAAQGEGKSRINGGGEERGTVEFDHVSLRYHSGGEEALTDIHFKAQRGDTIGVIGGTGSGKSSLVNLIPRFYDIEKGSVKVDGMDVREYSLAGLRDKIGIVMQKAVLFEGTIRDNLLWGNENASEDELWEALRTAQAEEFVLQKEKKLDERVEQEGRNLSGGQKQRLSIARALVKKPEILILDDSASALDYATDAALRKSIKEMPGETTVFIVSQRASSLLHADTIIVLDDGNVAGMGTHQELLKDCQVYQEIYYSQFEKKEGAQA